MIRNFPEALPRALLDRIIPDPTSGCWMWTGAIFKSTGYGAVSLKYDDDYGPHTVHRLVYRICTNTHPSESLCHTCHNKLCCNPNHLYLGNHSSNLKDAIRINAWTPWNRDKLVCIRGHAFSPENTHIDRRGHRVCKACKREGQIQRRKLRKDRNDLC